MRVKYKYNAEQCEKCINEYSSMNDEPYLCGRRPCPLTTGLLQDSDVRVQIMDRLKEIQEKYNYWFDEEDTAIEKLDYERGLGNVPDLEVLGHWINARRVIPLKIVEQILKEVLRGKL